MAQTERHRHGGQTLIEMPVLSGTVIEKGDFIALSALNETAIPVSGIDGAGSAANNRDAAADAFLGIAQTGSKSGSTEPVVVDISLESIHELELETAIALSFGDFVEIFADSAGAYDQLCVKGVTDTIAVCVKEISSGTKFLAKLTQQDKLNLEQT